MFDRILKLSFICAGTLLMCFSLCAWSGEIQEAATLFKQKKYAEAMEKVDSILSARPKDEHARFLKGLILTEQGKTNDAIRTFSALTEDYPEQPEPYNNLAVLLAGQEQYDQARIVLEKAMNTNPSYATAYKNLGDIYSQMASQAYNRALQQDPGTRNTAQIRLALISDLPADNNTGGKAEVGSSEAISNKSPSLTPKQVQPAAPVVPAAAIAAAEKPSNKPDATNSDQSLTSAQDEATRMVQAWASAWSSKNVSGYLSFYAKSFKTPNGMQRTAWEAQRKLRISKPGPIQVTLSNIHPGIAEGGHLVVTFRQHYRSTNLESATTKTLDLIKSDGRWLIQSEITGN